MSAEQDARRAPRLAIDLPARLEGRVGREVRVVDLSRTGCLVRCPGRLDIGAIFDLRMELAGRPLAAKVRVAESSVDGTGGQPGEVGCLAGISFLSLTPEDETLLLRFLDEERRKRCPPGH